MAGGGIAAGRGTAATSRPGPVKSADRTVELLELLAIAERPLTLTELHRELSYPKSSLFMLLQTLVARGWVEAARGGTAYGLGVRALLVGASYLDHDSAIRIAVRTLERLREHLDETCYLVRLDGADVVCLASRMSRRHLLAPPRVGRRVPAFASAPGKILLAQRSWAEVDALLPLAPAPLTRRTVTGRPDLRAQLDQVRVAGFAVEHGECTPGVAGFGVALPYRTPVVDALGCSVPLSRLTGPYAHQVVAALQAAGRHLTDLLRRGGRPHLADATVPPAAGR